MTETSATTSSIDRTFPVAMLMLSTHMLERSLPVPIGIHFPAPYDWPQAIRLHLSHIEPVDGWVGSIHVDEEHLRHTISQSGQYSYRHWLGRLPDSGVRVDLYVAVIEPHLQAVQA